MTDRDPIKEWNEMVAWVDRFLWRTLLVLSLGSACVLLIVTVIGMATQ